MLILLLAAWTCLRSFLWENPFPLPDLPVEWLVADVRPPALSLAANAHPEQQKLGNPKVRLHAPKGAAAKLSVRQARVTASAVQPFSLRDIGMGGGPLQISTFPIPRPDTASVMARADKPRVRQAATAAVPRHSPWSGDAWLFLRPNAMVPADATGTLATYGASQTGAVLRYRLSAASRFQPTAYLRASSSLTDAKQSDVALGISARPLLRLPVNVHAEMRASHVSGETEIWPSLFAVVAPAHLELPSRTEGRLYAQIGYVGGSFATPFVDGQAKIDREIARFGPEASESVGSRPLRLRAGVGAWGGAQRGAARADVGPTLAAQFDLGGLPVTAAADYRFRIAGEAQPTSGAALTLSTNF